MNLKALTSANLGIGIAFFVLTIFPAVAETPSEAYPPEYTQQYLQDCIATAKTEGLAEPEAQKLCGCTLTEFQQQYSLTAFKELNAKAETDETAANALIDVGQFCFESLLYEE